MINDTIITYFGQPVRVVCDRQCNKAWGINTRPRIQFDPADPDDYAYLTDDELGEAPADPGTYEGGQGKPSSPDEFPNKWCVRECERSAMSALGKHDEPLAPPSFAMREYNMPSMETERWNKMPIQRVACPNCETVFGVEIASGDQRDEILRLQTRIAELECDNATYKEWIAEHHYWEGYTCDACGQPFTLAEWDARETPHRVDCPNYDADTDEEGMMEFTECDCDRNYHSRCFDFSADPELTT